MASPQTSPPADGVGASSSPWRLAVYAITLFMFLAASNAPTPLYHLYQAEWHFSATVLSVVFAVYAFTLLLALLVFGSLSDHVGRWPVIVGALLVEVVAMLAFRWAASVTWLVVARLLQGAATGAATSALAAALLDADSRRGPVFAAVAPPLGLAFGVLGSSLIQLRAVDPLHAVYGVLVALFAVLCVLNVFSGERARRRAGAWASLWPRLTVPAAARPTLWRVIPINIAVWALGGFYFSLAPSLTERVIDPQSPLVAGVIVFTLPFVGGISVYTFRRRPAAVALRFGGWGLAVGLAITLAGVHGQIAALLLTGTAVAGMGFGAGFMGALGAVMPLAPVSERSALMAVFYVLSYLSFSVPAIIAGLSTQVLGVVPTTYGYGTVVAALALCALAGMARQRPACPVGG